MSQSNTLTTYSLADDMASPKILDISRRHTLADAMDITSPNRLLWQDEDLLPPNVKPGSERSREDYDANPLSPCTPTPCLNDLVDKWGALDPELDFLLSSLTSIIRYQDSNFRQAGNAHRRARKAYMRRQKAMDNASRGEAVAGVRRTWKLEQCGHTKNCQQRYLNYRCNRCGKNVCGLHKKTCGGVNCGSKRR